VSAVHAIQKVGKMEKSDQAVMQRAQIRLRAVHVMAKVRGMKRVVMKHVWTRVVKVVRAMEKMERNG
jgi:hypothetical protein